MTFEVSPGELSDALWEMWEDLRPIGRDDRTGGYRRFAWTPEDRAARDWFRAQAHRRGLDVTTDRNGNLWAWHGDPDAGVPGVVTGSHLDSVPDGGAYDGPLGIVSAFAALDLLRGRPLAPRRPLGIVAFTEEEGARFGVACLGSRLLTGALDPERARALTDTTGTSYADALTDAGIDPLGIGRDEDLLRRIGVFVELHIEQGRALADLDAPVGLADAIWPHGRWRCEFTGRADHAGTTRMEDRADPMPTYADTVLTARREARCRQSRATFGRLVVEPGGTNAIPSRVVAWLDARAPSPQVLDDLVTAVSEAARRRAARDGTVVEIHEESRTSAVRFDADLLQRLGERLGELLGRPPVLPTAAGHDAGILATAGIPTAMLFVRNPTG
ncbi:MAG TPA: allantoate amidohydrolase, partial [Actinopolymorphaceae bacterium]